MLKKVGQVTANYSESLLGTFGSSIIVHIIYLFQKYGAFNFSFGPYNYYFYKINVM
jgi:hypothetical protein